jgi:hypothetical protein
MKSNRSLGEGVELVKEDTFWPEGQWSIRQGEKIWSKTAGWKRYYEADKDCRFKTAEIGKMGNWYGSEFRQLSYLGQR